MCTGAPSGLSPDMNRTRAETIVCKSPNVCRLARLSNEIGFVLAHGQHVSKRLPT